MGADPGAQAGKRAIIDNKSMADYRREFENQRQQHRYATEAEICFRVKEYIKKRITGIVDEECRKRVMDLTTVALSCLSSMVIPFSGVAVVVAATVIQCLNFSITLGLIPVLNVRSFNDLVVMSKQIGTTIKRAGKSSLMAGVETAVLEILKNLGLGDWLWTEILRDILLEMIGDSAMDAAWIMTPLLAAPKYMMHRHLIKKMYRKLGGKAEIVHCTWMEHHCVTANSVQTQTTVVTQVAGGVQVDQYGNIQGACIQTQETVCATQIGAPSNGYYSQQPQTNTYYPQQAQPQQFPAYPPANQAPSYNPNPGMEQFPAYPPANQAPSYNPNPGMEQFPAYPPANQAPSYNPNPGMEQFPAYPPANQAPSCNPNPNPGMVQGYPQMPPPSNSNFFQPQPAAKPTGTVIMGYTPPANSSFFQPQPAFKPTGTLIMGHTPPANSSFFQPQVGGQFQPQPATFAFQAAAAAQIHTPQPNPSYIQQLPAYTTQQAQMYPPQAPYTQMGEFSKPQGQMVYPPPAGVYPPPATAPPQPDLWYQAQAK